ncbi:MAG: LysM domain-containing protein [Bacteroidota bacterium]
MEKGDTLNAIRNQLNAKYNTDLSTSDIANRNNINNPDKIYPGQNIKPPVLQDRANALAGEVSKRGKFLGKGEADWLYQINSDRNLGVTVDASQLTFKRDGNWVRDPKGGKKASGHVTGDEYWIHGQGTVRHRPNETYGLYDGSYDFEMHSVRGLKDIVRNIGTIIGAPPAGFPNTPYSIHYKGNVNVKNP